jgi:hypothetical protein
MHDMIISSTESHLVLDDLDLDGDALVVLEHLAAADVHAHRGVELERVAARGHLGVAVHHADLAAQLVEEEHGGVRLGQRAGDLAQRLGHEARLQAHLLVRHVALQLRARDQRRHRVHHHDVHGGGAHELVHHVQRHLA